MAHKSKISLTNEQRQLICFQKDKNRRWTQEELAEWAKTTFKLSSTPTQAMISRIVNNKNYRELKTQKDLQTKRRRDVKNQDLEDALVGWVLQMQTKRIRLSTDLIRQKGKDFASQKGIKEGELRFSNGWLQRFLHRHQLGSVKMHGESGSVDETALEEALPQLREQISRYDLKDVYNMDETGLFYRLAPDRTIAREQLKGDKKDKKRMSIAFTSNAAGTDKLPLLFIGNFKKPRCFEGNTGQALGFDYHFNKKAWMTNIIFREWIEGFNSRMQRSGQNILLLDNATSHITLGLTLSNITVLKLPPNTTSRIQPMDAGIIASFKCRYRQHQLRFAIDQIEAGKTEADEIYQVNQLRAMRWCVRAWDSIPAETIRNCYMHTSLFDKAQPAVPSIVGESEEVERLRQTILQLGVQEPLPIDEYLSPLEEEALVHYEFSDTELLAGAMTTGEESALEEVESEDDEPPQPSNCEKLAALRLTISLLDGLGLSDSPANEEEITAAQRVLRAKQESIRLEVEASKKQTTLDQFFI